MLFGIGAVFLEMIEFRYQIMQHRQSLPVTGNGQHGAALSERGHAQAEPLAVASGILEPLAKERQALARRGCRVHVPAIRYTFLQGL